MQKYQIDRWDSVIPKGNTFPYPMIYIKPDENILKYAEQNQYRLLLTIKDSKSNYDDKIFIGVLDSSAFFPEYRPNLFNEHKQFVITIITSWDGYPTSNGYLNVNLEGNVNDSLETKFQVPKPIEWYTHPTSTNSGKKISIKQPYIFIPIVILILIAILIILFYKRK